MVSAISVDLLPYFATWPVHAVNVDIGSAGSHRSDHLSEFTGRDALDRGARVAGQSAPIMALTFHAAAYFGAPGCKPPEAEVAPLETILGPQDDPADPVRCGRCSHATRKTLALLLSGAPPANVFPMLFFSGSSPLKQ